MHREGRVGSKHTEYGGRGVMRQGKQGPGGDRVGRRTELVVGKEVSTKSNCVIREVGKSSVDKIKEYL